MNNEMNSDVEKKLEAIGKVIGILKDFGPYDITDIVAFALKHVGVAETISMPSPRNQLGVNSDMVENETLAEFVHKRNPKNEYQRIAVIAYYLMKKKNLSVFMARDIADANAEARQPRFSNLSTSINRAVTRYKYLTSTKRGEYRLGVDAEKMVEVLPDHSEAKKITFGARRTKRKKVRTASDRKGDE
jgi:hypothetical protein